jgi:glycosyltransferase involved in cell wall biosynthesis
MTDAEPLSQLTVCYSSLLSRVGDIEPPQDPEVEVLVLVQGEGDLPEEVRPGTRLVRLDDMGVARSRNAAIDLASRRYLLFCDDDVRVDLAGVAEGIARLQRTGAAVALGRGITPDGDFRKQYADDGTPLTLFNTARAATYEMLIDVEQVRAHGIRFDPRFGAGAPYYLGDEYVFIADALRAGLRGYAVGQVFGSHPVNSSGAHWGTREDRRARAVVINRVFGRRALPARLAFARRRLRLLGPLGALLFVLDGTRPAGSPPERSITHPSETEDGRAHT